MISEVAYHEKMECIQSHIPGASATWAIYCSFTTRQVPQNLWYVVLWSVIAVVTIVRLEMKDWLGGVGELRLPPVAQLLMAFTLVLGAALATEWESPGIRALTSWAYAVFALLSYRQGYA